MPRIRLYAWIALVVNILVIAGGALVRATGSGAGCGRSWPTCQGELVPAELGGATLIEFGHRAFAGVALLTVLAVFSTVMRHRERGIRASFGALWATPIERAAALALIAVIGEALIGAGLVLFEWVASDSSIARTIAVPLHLVNTLLLLGALAVIVGLAEGRDASGLQRADRRRLAFGLGAMLVVAAAGAVTALADTLFPSESLTEGVATEFSSTADWLTRLRVIHPILAVATAVLLVWLVSNRSVPASARSARPARAVVGLVVVQTIAGSLNVVLLTPVWMQLVHLVLADLLWVAFVWFAMDVGSAQSSSASASGVPTGAAQTIRSHT